MDKFEQWFINQDFYTNMRLIHGDALFIKDGDVYRVLPVQMTWVAWQSRQAEIDQLSTQNELLKKIAEDDMAKIERLESVINQNDAELKEKDKWIETALDLLIDGHYELAEQMLRGERE